MISEVMMLALKVVRELVQRLKLLNSSAFPLGVITLFRGKCFLRLS